MGPHLARNLNFMADTNLRILLTGWRGQVGQELLPRLSEFSNLLLVNSQRVAQTVVAQSPQIQVATLDLTQGEQLRQLIHKHQPHFIINAAAYTAVDRAETERAMAYQVNVAVPETLGRCARELNATVIHYSTDY